MRHFNDATEEERAAFAMQAARQVDNLETALGRELTEAEGEKLADELVIRYEHNEPVHGLWAWWNVAERPDLETQAGRTEYTRARLAFDEADNDPSEQTFDLSTHEGRVGYVEARTAGADGGVDATRTGHVQHRPSERATLDILIDDAAVDGE